jgi:hypothetical protein
MVVLVYTIVLRISRDFQSVLKFIYIYTHKHIYIYILILINM